MTLLDLPLMLVNYFGPNDFCRQFYHRVYKRSSYSCNTPAKAPSPPSPTPSYSSLIYVATMAQSLPHPDSYTAWAFLERGGELEKITMPWKDPEENHIVVQVLACGVCGRRVSEFHLPSSSPRLVC